MSFPESWTEVALVAISKEAGSDVEYTTITESVDISPGDKPMESIPNLQGGRITKFTPEEDTEITLEIYPVELDSTSADGGFFQQFYGGTWDTSEPLQVLNRDDTNHRPNIRDKFRVALLWTNDATATGGAAATAASTDALRFVMRNSYITSHKASFTDDILKVTVTFKCAAADKAGDSNCLWQSGDQTELVALGSYTSSSWYG